MALVRPWWVTVVGALDAVAGGVLVCAGVYLLDPAALTPDVYVEAGRYALAAWFLIYAGAVLAAAGIAGYAPPRLGLGRFIGSVIFGNMALLAIGLIACALGVRAWLDEPARVLVGLLVVPGVLALLSFGFEAAARARALAPVADEPISAESGKDRPQPLREYLLAGLTAAIGNVLVIAYLGFGFLLYYVLEAILIQDAHIDLARLAIVFAAYFERLWPIALAVGGVVLIVVPVIGLLGNFARRRAAFARDLTPEEVSYVTASAAALKTYVDGRGYQALALRIRRRALVALAAGCSVGLWLLLTIERLIAALYAPAAEAGWRLYVVNGSGISVAVFVFAVAVAFVPGAAMALVSRRIGEAGGLLMLGAAGGFAPVRSELVRLVRAGALKREQAFDPAAFLFAANRGAAMTTLICAGALTAGLALWWPFDRASDTLYTEDGIATADGWSLQRSAYAYASVSSVALKCAIDGGGATSIGYRIALPEGLRRDLFTRGSLGREIDDLVRVDAKLRDAGVAFAFALPEELPSVADVVDRMCVVALTEGMDDAARERIEQLFHLDEWFERRWRLRTGGKPRVVDY